LIFEFIYPIIYIFSSARKDVAITSLSPLCPLGGSGQ
jgi:hypothetical protein